MKDEILKELGYEEIDNNGIIRYKDEKGVNRFKTESNGFELKQAISIARESERAKVLKEVEDEVNALIGHIESTMVGNKILVNSNEMSNDFISNLNRLNKLLHKR